MRHRGWFPWVLVTATAIAGARVGAVSADAISEPGWPPPEGDACKPSKKAVDEAKTLFRLGTDAYATSNFTDAIKYWKDAYKRDCSAHVLLKNLGKAYEADAQYAAAVEALKLYRVRAKITGEELDLIDAKITHDSARISAAPTATAIETAAPTATPTATPTTTPTTTATAAPAATATATSTPPPPLAPPSSGGAGIGPVMLMIGGGVIFAAGGVVWVIENGKVSTATSDLQSRNCANFKPGDRNFCLGRQDELNSASSTRTTGLIVAGVGVVAAGAGVAWYLLGRSDDAAGTATVVTPTVLPGFAGLSVSGRF